MSLKTLKKKDSKRRYCTLYGTRAAGLYEHTELYAEFC